MRLILAAAAAKRHDRRVVHDAIQIAIEGHLKFSVGDVTAISRLHNAYDGFPASFYGMAIQCDAMSFVKAFEADRDFQPWLWPSCLTERRDGKTGSMSRLFVGQHIWFEHKDEMCLWEVTGCDRFEVRITISTHGMDHLAVCNKCNQKRYDSERSKVIARKTLNREQWKEHVDRLQSYSKLGILEDGRLVAWKLTPYDGATGPDEQAWTGSFVFGWNSPYGHAKLADALVLKSRGFVVHGKSLRNARGMRKQKIREWETTITEQSEGRNIDQKMSVTRLRSVLDLGMMAVPAIVRSRLRGETISIRQLLMGSSDALRDAYALCNILYYYDHHDSYIESPETRKAREDARKKEESDRRALLETSRDVKVRVSHSLDVGNCPMGTRAWLMEYFPDFLPKYLQVEPDHDKLRAGLRKIKKTITVGKIIDLPKSPMDVVPVLMHAIKSQST